jgi:hypothetical protein
VGDALRADYEIKGGRNKIKVGRNATISKSDATKSKFENLCFQEVMAKLSLLFACKAATGDERLRST